MKEYPQQIRPDGPNTYLVPKGCVLIREPYSENAAPLPVSGQRRRASGPPKGSAI